LENLFFYPRLRKFILNSPSNLSHRQSGLIIDVGANIGQSAKFFKKVFPLYEIICFEPSPTVFAKLAELDIKSAKFENIALGSHSGKMDFFESPFSESSTFVLPKLDSKWQKRKELVLGISRNDMYKKISVELITLDKYLVENQIREVDWLKIDVEGFEFQVLDGSRESLSTQIFTYIQVESHSSDMRSNDSKKIQNLLFSYNYKLVTRFRHPFGNFFEDIYIRS
jgi:FkbM family methyltransferase